MDEELKAKLLEFEAGVKRAILHNPSEPVQVMPKAFQILISVLWEQERRLNEMRLLLDFLSVKKPAALTNKILTWANGVVQRISMGISKV